MNLIGIQKRMKTAVKTQQRTESERGTIVYQISLKL